jgi:hypothetical protein
MALRTLTEDILEMIRISREIGSYEEKYLALIQTDSYASLNTADQIKHKIDELQFSLNFLKEKWL